MSQMSARWDLFFLGVVRLHTIGVNLGIFHDIWRDLIIDAEETPQQKPPTGLGFFLDPRFYKDAAETPQQINPTELKRALKSSMFSRRSRFGWNAGRIWVCTPQNRTYRPGDRGGRFFLN